MLARKLINWFSRNKRDLPWRRTKDPYRIWISEVMLQQTTVKTVIPYYNRWVVKFPRIEDVARSPLSKILTSWQGLGYYHRAKNIHKSAKIICREHKGKIPRSVEEIETLPGFGPYTVGAVLSLAYGMKVPIIDANIRRVVMRLLGAKGKAEANKDKRILRFLVKNIPFKKAGQFNEALMELGAMICKSRSPLCLQCPIKGYCMAYKKGIQEVIPSPKVKKLQSIDVVVGVIRKNNYCLIQKRPSKGLLADLWEFPGGKIKKGESVRTALKRELFEELGVKVVSSSPLTKFRHYYTSYKVNLNAHYCTLVANPKLNRVRKWVSLDQIQKYPMPSGSLRIVDLLRSGV